MKRIATILVMLTLAACAKAPPVPPDSFYRLPAPEAKDAVLPPLSKGIISVRPLRSDGLRSERPILFSDDPSNLSLRQHHYHFWVDTPQRLVQRQLIAYLRAVRAAPMVVGEGDVGADMTIGGHIMRFEYSRDGARETVHLELELRVDRADTERPLLLRAYQADLPVSGTGMVALVQAFDQGLQEIFRAFIDDLRVRGQAQS